MKVFKFCGCNKYCTDHEQLLRRSESLKRNSRGKRSRLNYRGQRDTHTKYVYPEFSIYGTAHDHPTSYPLVPGHTEQAGERDTAPMAYVSYPVDINMDDIKFSDDSDEESDDDDEFEVVPIDGVVEDEAVSVNQQRLSNAMNIEEMQEGKNDENDSNEVDGGYVADEEAEGDNKKTPLWYRIFWIFC